METPKLHPIDFDRPAPYSLGKLIEWKLSLKNLLKVNKIYSLLVREINWMETPSILSMIQCSITPYSLGKLIEWKQKKNQGSGLQKYIH
jgi:hypothetical protein